MAIVNVTDPTTNIIYNYYLDDKMKRAIDKKILPAISKAVDDDYVMVIDGKERSGKSTLAQQIGRYIDPTLNVSRICFSPEEFREAVMNADKGQCVIFDEAYRGYGSSSALSEVNRILKAMMMEMGQKNLFVIIILPTFYLLEKYVAIWRAKCLIHVYRIKATRGYWRGFNARKKMKLYLNPIGKKFYSYTHVKTSFKGKFFGKIVIDDEEYKKKKSKSFMDGFKQTREEKSMFQRDILVYYLHSNYKMTQESITKVFKDGGSQLARTTITEIIRKMKERSG